MEPEVKQVVKEKEYVHGSKEHEYASNGKANAALTLGIIGTAGAGLALWGRNRGFFGGGMPENVNINTLGGAGAYGSVAPTAFQAWEKSCDEALALTNTIWGLKVNTMERMYAHRDTDVSEKFGLYKSQVEGDFGNYKATRDLYDNMNDKLNNAAFGLYKGQRDLYDTLNERYSEKFCELDKKVYGMEVANLYQNKIIQMGMENVLKESMCYTDRKTCNVIRGRLVLPNTPVVSGLGSFCCCGSNSGATAAAE